MLPGPNINTRQVPNASTNLLSRVHVTISHQLAGKTFTKYYNAM